MRSIENEGENRHRGLFEYLFQHFPSETKKTTENINTDDGFQAQNIFFPIYLRNLILLYK